MGNRATLIIMGMALSLVHTNPGKEIRGYREKSPNSCEQGVRIEVPWESQLSRVQVGFKYNGHALIHMTNWYKIYLVQPYN